MTRTASARLAGFAFLFYIAVGITSSVLFRGASGGAGAAARLANMADHAPEVRLAAVLTLLASFSAIVLGVTLYGITRDADHEVAMLGLTFRVAEGVLGGMSVDQSLGLLWLATNAPDPVTARGLGGLLFERGGDPTVTATFFAVGSTLFSWLLLRGRMVPVPLAWLGVAASLLLVICLPLRLGGLLGGPVVWLIWMPMLVFEVGLALWLIAKGVTSPTLGITSRQRTVQA